MTFLITFALAEESFINQYEYGEMLYKHPRGVGCDKCHGEYGDGKELGTYQKKQKTILIVAPVLKDLNSTAMLEATKKKRGVMPTYFLTQTEINAIVYYLARKNERLNKPLKD
ncbi:MAG: hypothetical protein RL154_754 [Pseudomonadota bacterium]